MRILVVIAAAVLGISFCASGAHAANPTVTSIDVEPFVARIGDRMTLTITVAHDTGITISGPGAAEDFGGLELIEIAEPVTTPADEGETTTLVYTVAAFTLGNDAVPPLEINWRGPGIEGTVTTPAAPFTVDGTVQPGDDTILPLKAQFEIPQPAPPPYVPATFVAMMAGLTVAGYWLMRRAMAVQPPPLLRPGAVMAAPDPALVARWQLDALALSGAATTDPGAYYASLAATVRRYLSARYEFPAYALTRREMERGMRQAGIDRWPARLTANLLEECDAVQFAVFRPAIERREQDLTSAYEIVDVTSGEVAIEAEPERA
jgi:hypothetical protein